MNRLKIAFTGIAAALMLTGCAGGQSSAGDSGAANDSRVSAASGIIGVTEAEKAALEHSGLTSDGVTFTKSEYDKDSSEYDIEFTAGGYRYEYDISAADGSIVGFSKKIIENVSGTQTGDTGTSSPATDTSVPDTDNSLPSDQTSQPEQTPQSETGRIPPDEAVNGAMYHAGVTLIEVNITNMELDSDGGREIYEIEFVSDEYEYDYEIDAESGAVLSHSKEALPAPPSGTSENRISSEKAKAAALGHAGVSASDVTFTKIKLDRDDGREVYDIEFVSDEYEYEYEIDAESGAVLSDSREARSAQPSGTSGEKITSEEAKAAALGHAGVSASGVTFTKIKLDRDDGRDVYDIEFVSDEYEYEYEIDAESGAVLSDSREARTSRTVNSAEGRITFDEVKTAVLAHAGVSEADATFTRTKIERDDGREEYDIKFYAGGKKYEYSVDASTGEIIEYDIED